MSLRAIASGTATPRDLPPSGGEFAIMCRAMMASKGDLLQAAALSKSWHATQAVQSALEKSAVDPAGLTGGWGTGLSDPDLTAVIGAFLGSLKNVGAFDRMLGDMVNVPLRTVVGLVTGSMVASTVGAGMIKPITSMEVSTDAMTESKVAAIVCVTNEFARAGGALATNLLSAELRKAVALETDTEFLRIVITGASAVSATGIDARALLRDLNSALAGMTLHSGSRVYMLMRSTLARSISTMFSSTGQQAFPTVTYSGGQLAGIPIIVCDGVPAGDIILVDATQLAAGTSDIGLRTITHGDIHLSSTPDSPQTASTTMTSLFQTRQTALLVERLFSVKLLSTVASAVGVISNGAYTDSPSP